MSPSLARHPLVWFLALAVVVGVVLLVRSGSESEDAFALVGTDGESLGAIGPAGEAGGAEIRDPANPSPEVAVLGLVAMVEAFFPTGDPTVPGPLAELLGRQELRGLPAELRVSWDRLLDLRRQLEAGDLDAAEPAREALTRLRTEARALLENPPEDW